jgi:glutaredoxin
LFFNYKLLLLWAMVWAVAGVQAQTPDGQDALEVFVRDGCPHCAEAKIFLETLAVQRPRLKIVLRPLGHDPAAKQDLDRYTRSAGLWPPGVPTFVFKGRVVVGFGSAERTGPALLDLAANRGHAIEGAVRVKQLAVAQPHARAGGVSRT